MRKLFYLFALLFLLPLVSAQEVNQILGMLGRFGLWTVIGVAIIFVFVCIGGGVWFWKWKQKQWYLKIEFKMPRSDGRGVIAEQGKGYYDTNNGTLWVKRVGKKKEDIKAVDMRKYLQGEDIITLVGSSGNWKPVIVESFTQLIDEETGEEAHIMNIKVNMRNDKPWAITAERKHKGVWTVEKIWHEFGYIILFGINTFLVILGLGVLYYLLK